MKFSVDGLLVEVHRETRQRVDGDQYVFEFRNKKISTVTGLMVSDSGWVETGRLSLGSNVKKKSAFGRFCDWLRVV